MTVSNIVRKRRKQVQVRDTQEEEYQRALRFFARERAKRAERAAEQEQVLVINGVELRVRPAER